MIPGGVAVGRLGILRNDALGDTLLSLPIAAAAKEYDRSIQVELICNSSLAPLFEGHPGLDGVVADPGGSAADLARVLRQRNYNAIIVVRPTPRNAWAAYKARIPLRVGTFYRIYGLLFNVRWYGHRRTNERHEVEYNVELFERLTGVPSGKPQYYLTPPPRDRAAAHALLEESGITLKRPIVGLHPGSRVRSDGTYSSLPWPPHHYATLARLILEEGYQVLITGTPEESAVTDQVAAVEGTVDLAGRTTLGQLAWVLKECDSVVSNSTGALHLAAGVGTKVVGIYPANESSSPVRWGPYGPGNKIFRAPTGACPGRECTGEECSAYNCMEKVLPVDVFKVAKGIVTQSPLRSRWEGEATGGRVRQ